jgi:hypothetical protein
VDRYSVLNFRIPTVFDIISLEWVRFRNSWYFVSSRSFSCPALPFSLSFSYLNIKVENSWGVFRPFPTVFIHRCDSTTLLHLHSAGDNSAVAHAGSGLIWIKAVRNENDDSASARYWRVTSIAGWTTYILHVDELSGVSKSEYRASTFPNRVSEWWNLNFFISSQP